eukprot:Blabericola_migrator_1__7826@NODE_3_length_32604_cov_133_371700_g2_i0_p3_GENE_NODE_3_length_32604_cov_133_371700_g2_i0NODE_3_length_32604_cov_133_371700_g2_i0_p3_ORF_typecomplete_len1200_score287_13DUF812/PF05667_11/0_00045DUF4201/PF13870_6/5DUF4201/PF13870_6/0_48Atg14/PF10186_9/0_12Prominin/PF05478_11/0_15CALCOCO1/PF07888_11/0_31GP57/PF17594_2/7_6e02GP57/PF17594_2/0_24AAA_13/PF13166_6/1_9HMMR_N/PF15905_5/14Tmemb_cc2/PF10267_9/3_1Phage_HK97_TLTM/PF06120_11/4e03Phage_HK97_TLTM/PF06120_11/3_5e03Ph
MRRSILRQPNDQPEEPRRLSVTFSNFKEVRYLDDDSEVAERRQLTPISESIPSESPSADGMDNHQDEDPEDSLPWLKTLRTSFDLNDDLSPKLPYMSNSINRKSPTKKALLKSDFEISVSDTSQIGAKLFSLSPTHVEVSYAGDFARRVRRQSIENSITPGFPEVTEPGDQYLTGADSQDEEDYLLEAVDDSSSGTKYCPELFQNPKRKVLKRSIMSLAGGPPAFLRPNTNFRESLLNRESLTEGMKVPESLLEESGEEQGEEEEESMAEPPPEPTKPPEPAVVFAASPVPQGRQSLPTKGGPAASPVPRLRVVESDIEKRFGKAPHDSTPLQSDKRKRGARTDTSSSEDVSSGAASSVSAGVPDSKASSAVSLRSNDTGPSFSSSCEADEEEGAGDEGLRYEVRVEPSSDDDVPKELLGLRVQDSLQRHRPKILSPESFGKPTVTSPEPPSNGTPQMVEANNRKRISTPDFGKEEKQMSKKRKTTPSPPYDDCVEKWCSPAEMPLGSEAPITSPKPSDKLFSDVAALAEKFLPSLRSPISKAKDLLSPLFTKKEGPPPIDLPTLTVAADVQKRAQGTEVLITPRNRLDAWRASRMKPPHPSDLAGKGLEVTIRQADALKVIFTYMGLQEVITDIETAYADLQAQRQKQQEEPPPKPWQRNLSDLMENDGMMLHSVATNISAVLASQIVEQQAAAYSERLAQLIGNCQVDALEVRLDHLVAEGVKVQSGDRSLVLKTLQDSLKTRICLLELDLEKWWKTNFGKPVIQKTIELTNNHLRGILGTFNHLLKQLSAREEELDHIEQGLKLAVQNKKSAYDLNVELVKSLKLLESQAFQVQRKIQVVKDKGVELQNEIDAIKRRQADRREAIERYRKRCARLEEVLSHLMELKMTRQLTEIANNIVTMDYDEQKIILKVSPAQKISNILSTFDVRMEGTVVGREADEVNRGRALLRSAIPKSISELPLLDLLWNMLPPWILTFNASEDKLPSLESIDFKRNKRNFEGFIDKAASGIPDTAFECRVRAFESIILHLKEAVHWHLTHQAKKMMEKKSDIPAWVWLCIGNVKPLVDELLKIKIFGDGDLRRPLVIKNHPSHDRDPSLDTKLFYWYSKPPGEEDTLEWLLRLYVPRDFKGRHQLVCVDIQMDVAVALSTGSLIHSKKSCLFKDIIDQWNGGRSVSTTAPTKMAPRDLTEFIKKSLFA